MGNVGSMFSGIDHVKAARAANYVRPGMYFMLINGVKADRSRKGDDFIAFELTCIHVLQGESKEGRGSISHKPGEDVSYLLMNAGRQKDMFLPKIKGAVSEIVGCDPTEVGVPQCEAMVGPEQPFAGLIVEMHAREITTRDGKPFTLVSFKGQVSQARLEELGVPVPPGAKFLD